MVDSKRGHDRNSKDGDAMDEDEVPDRLYQVFTSSDEFDSERRNMSLDLGCLVKLAEYMLSHKRTVSFEDIEQRLSHRPPANRKIMTQDMLSSLSKVIREDGAEQDESRKQEDKLKTDFAKYSTE